jgi:hypothetical protein
MQKLWILSNVLSGSARLRSLHLQLDKSESKQGQGSGMVQVVLVQGRLRFEKHDVRQFDRSDRTHGTQSHPDATVLQVSCVIAVIYVL